MGKTNSAESKKNTSIIPAERIINTILLIRGEKVILDSDLAALYGVTTSRLNEQVKRNRKRFPEDFMFQLGRDEYNNMKSQFAISSLGWGGRRKLPYVFTEHGAIMAASILNSKKAVQVSIFVVRAFVKLRQMLVPYKNILKKVEQLESKLQNHDRHITAIVEAIKLLMPSNEEKHKQPIGYLSEKKISKK